MSAVDEEKRVPNSSAVEKQDEVMEEDTFESRKLYPIIRKKADGFFKFIFSHRMIPILKGTPTLTSTNLFRLIHVD